MEEINCIVPSTKGRIGRPFRRFNTGRRKGNVAYGTLTTLSESPFQFGYLYTGSDDGLVYKSTNGGGSWTRISDSFPKDLWVSRVVASQHQKDRVYVTLNGYRWDDFTPYVYKSDDGGENWEAIESNLPLSPVNVLREDPKMKTFSIGNDTGSTSVLIKEPNGTLCKRTDHSGCSRSCCST